MTFQERLRMMTISPENPLEYWIVLDSRFGHHVPYFWVQHTVTDDYPYEQFCGFVGDLAPTYHPSGMFIYPWMGTRIYRLELQQRWTDHDNADLLHYENRFYAAP